MPEVSFVYCGSSSVDLNFQVAFCLGHSLSQNCYERLSPRADLCYDAFTIAHLHDDVTRAKNSGSCSQIRGMF